MVWGQGVEECVDWGVGFEGEGGDGFGDLVGGYDVCCVLVCGYDFQYYGYVWSVFGCKGIWI